MREVSTALDVLSQSVEKLRLADSELTDEEKELAEYYMERVGDLQSFFELARMFISSFLAAEDGPDFGSVTSLNLDDFKSEFANLPEPKRI